MFDNLVTMAKSLAQSFNKERITLTFDLNNPAEIFAYLSKAGIIVDKNGEAFALAPFQLELLTFIETKLKLSRNGHKLKCVVAGARGIGKTEVGTTFDTILTIAKNPDHKEVIVCRDDERAKAILKTVERGLTLLGVATKHHNGALFTLNNQTSTPTLKALTIKSKGIRGTHINRVKIEDPLDEYNCKSTAECELVSFILHEFKAKADCTLILTNLTSNHPSDPIHNLIQHNDTLRLFIDHPEVAKLLAMRGVSKEEELKERTLRSWGLNYEGIFYPDTETIFHGIRLTDKTHCTSAIYCVIDPSFTVGNDYTAMAIGGINEDNQLIAYLYGWQKPYHQVVNQIAEFIIKNHVHYTHYESQDSNPHLQTLLSNYGIKSSFFRSTKNKTERILSLKPLVNSGAIAISDATPIEFITLLREWHPTTKGHDDIPDVLHMLKEVVYARVSIHDH